MLSSLQSILQHNCKIGINKPVVTGVSGGPDSLCLLDLLWRLDYQVIIAHLNHCIRPEADEEAKKVQEEANARGLPFVTQKVDVPAYAEEHKLSVEEAARIVRYDFLFAQARLFNAQAVAVGHNADDQVETILMHLLRGSGLAGLIGMDYYMAAHEFDDTIPLVRPLLGFWRVEISEYIKEHGLRPAIDESNWDRSYFRNRLRHELIPVLESYNPRFKRAFYRMADILRSDNDVIKLVIDEAWDACFLSQGQGFVVYSASSIRDEPLGVQRHLLRRGIEILQPGLRNIDFGMVERGIASLNASGKPKSDLSMGLYVMVEEGRFILASYDAEMSRGDWPQIPEGLAFSLDVPGECSLPNGWLLRCEKVDDPAEAYDQALYNQDQYQAWMDADKIIRPIMVRGRRAGDRICPQGMDGHSIKISDLMINEKMPSRARVGWPLLVANGEIIWIPGYRLGHEVQLRQGVHQIIHFELRRSRSV